MKKWRDLKLVMKRIIDIVLGRRQAYRATFDGPAGQIVLADLRKFCRGTSTPAVVSPITQQIDPIATGIAIGRQEVWHRIAQNLHLSDSDIYKMMEQTETD